MGEQRSRRSGRPRSIVTGAVLGLVSSALTVGCGRVLDDPLAVPAPLPSPAVATSSATVSVTPSPTLPPVYGPTVPASATARPTFRPVPVATPTRPAATSRPAASSRPAPSSTPTARPRRLPPDPARTLSPAPPGSRGVVFLTFDDGPGPATAAVLSVLTRHHATATFFQLGVNARQRPGDVAAVQAQGSRIGNHTDDHRDLTRLSERERGREWAHGPRARCARPPYGATDAEINRQLRRLGMQQVLWDVDTLDWTRPGAELIYRRGAGAAVHAGSIVLLHDGGGDRSQTVAALPRILTELQRRGFVVRALPYC